MAGSCWGRRCHIVIIASHMSPIIYSHKAERKLANDGGRPTVGKRQNIIVIRNLYHVRAILCWIFANLIIVVVARSLYCIIYHSLYFPVTPLLTSHHTTIFGHSPPLLTICQVHPLFYECFVLESIFTTTARVPPLLAGRPYVIVCSVTGGSYYHHYNLHRRWIATNRSPP